RPRPSTVSCSGGNAACDCAPRNSLNLRRARHRWAMLADLQNAYIQAVEPAGDSTVNVSTAQRPYGPPWGSWPRRGFGSGVVLDDQGNTLTTHNVVQGAAKDIVTCTHGRLLCCSVLLWVEAADNARGP